MGRAALSSLTAPHFGGISPGWGLTEDHHMASHLLLPLLFLGAGPTFSGTSLTSSMGSLPSGDTCPGDTCVLAHSHLPHHSDVTPKQLCSDHCGLESLGVKLLFGGRSGLKWEHIKSDSREYCHWPSGRPVGFSSLLPQCRAVASTLEICLNRAGAGSQRALCSP